ncbi:MULTISPECIES: biotin--[acetyl-CoA-carboxylase] ligase [unclassified Thermosynechococcus]|uniref:biotin--[acetyl-CoA-carboxylase] ligase n=1 Tax=unclassified Thermosynechococcus TaxID=2622553 RepID=UPI00197D6193|nr:MULTISPECIES: biotin--[acetyl-CoA-carboxylase] ligase [unclassified Thermosynechococcus]QSF49526.1 biotin--[acetyl-CoA-carboxylase] ligase [Thermosynechococcus sp. TA-1]WNC22604.1 biotin--[acetyl-CoA-carboxylase] ligase [Thermosynechococcus sp. PP22]WNC32843.1 biotin--[acetyl-CoA-carboxylase] ligase [Thermosynechococcus sp. PKX95]WNC35369.1 biotin--[acetyl-CoA-carboxylase] ligase [Thermosynechococcus sp. PKX91]WNC37889.1 biotin--[acetyl-CoA-carboxylase] ligase [Thermosynechococcus sp. WL11]
MEFPWLVWLETCESTNTWALHHADQLYGGQVIYTQAQTRGRGQYNRTWQSPKGVLTASFILPQSPAIVAPSVQAGIAVMRALSGLRPTVERHLQLKWPNDVMAQGKKLAGILCEGRSPWLVVGLGLNRCVDVEAMGLPQAISLHTLLHSPQAVPTDLELLAAIRAELLWCWQQSQGVQITAQQDFLRGRSLTLVQGEQRWQGIGVGISDRGTLQVRLNNGELREFSSGHVLYSSDRAP